MIGAFENEKNGEEEKKTEQGRRTEGERDRRKQESLQRSVKTAQRYYFCEFEPLATCT